MNSHIADFLLFRRWASILGGLLLIGFSSFYFLQVSAETETGKNSAEQNLTLGRLAFSSQTFGPTIPEARIYTINSDGSGQMILPMSSPTFASEPAWSPDATKFAFSWTQSPYDIYVININGSGQIDLTNTPNIREANPSWSVTGKIAYERAPDTVDGKIWVMNPDGTGNVQFPGLTQPLPTAPAWSPDGTKIAFVSGNQIWVINGDGTNERRITMNTATNTNPAWSPDGSKIVFAKSGSGITVINADGTNETTLSTSVSDIQPSWSPDGTKIAFRGSASGISGIYMINADGSNQVRIVADIILFPSCCDTQYNNPAWQPVAQMPNTYVISGRIANNTLPVSGVTVNLSGTTNAAATTDAAGNYQFSGLPAGGSYTVSPSLPKHYFTPPNRSFNNLASNQTGDFEVLGVCQGGRCVKNGKIAFSRSGDIFTINPDGTGQTNITNNAANNGGANYSPDGSNIIFNTNRDGNYEIYRINADGTSPVRLTNNAASDFSPYYSFDGATIVFVSDRDGNYEIYRMNADGSNQVRLTNSTSNDYDPAFSPDGQKIIYVSAAAQTPTKLFIMNADGSNPQPLPDSFGFSPGYNLPSYSPDGSKIIFTYTSDASTQIRVNWTMNADGTNRVKFPADGSYGTYSPDGAKVAYTCCILNNTNRLLTADASGSAGSVRTLTPSNTGNSSIDWQGFIIPRAPFDFDGDGRSDISVFRPSDHTWYLLRSQKGFAAMLWGLSTDVPAPADYDGDLRTDVAVWRPSSGYFYILNSFNNTFRYENFGLSGDVPVGGDWDGDGKADVAVYRGGTQGVFYYRGSTGNPQGNITAIQWGTSGDKPVAGDYDGDGRTDAAIFRPSSGTWYILQSSGGQLFAANFGLANDTLVPADYDADGRIDLAVYRGGAWYLLRSAQGFTAFQFGISNDIPAPADYDGDGRADAGVFRNGVWYIMKTQSAATEAVSFGFGSDAPVPAAFVR